MAVPFRIAASMVFFVFPICAFAQAPTDNPADEEDVKVLAPITVTGSRIRRIDIETPMPVVVFDRVDLEAAAVNTLEEFMRKLPLNWGPVGDSLLGSYDRDVGFAAFDLRGIGADATLTLVNGRRIAPYAVYTGLAIDVNAIPVSAIDRIEVLKDGASAIYGAEAIAGVVNIILRSDYNGIETNFGYGISEFSDAEEYLADVVAGRDNGRSSIMFSLSWFQRDGVPMADRDWASTLDYSAIGGPDYGNAWSSPPTFFRYDTFTFAADPQCGTDPQISWVGSFEFTPGDGGTLCEFNVPQYVGLIAGIERLGATLSGRYEIHGNLSAFGDLLYSEVDSDNYMAPSPIGQNPDPLIQTWLGYPWVGADHPDNPFGTDGELGMRTLDTGNRIFAKDSDAIRVVAGLDGTLGSSDWQASILFAENNVSQTGYNLVSQSRLQLALIGQGGPGGDLYYNPFGFEPENDPALVEWFKTTTLDRHTSQVYGADLDWSTFFGTLPGGPVGLAAGLEYRRQDLEQQVDEQKFTGDLAGGYISGGEGGIDADRNVVSAFVEFSLPLHETVEAQLAARYDHYDDFGSTTNPKLALRWQPLPSLMLRGSYSTAFTPPSFAELYGPTYTDVANIVDSVRCPLTGLTEDCSRWTPRTVISSGNPDLDPEEGTSWFAGLVWGSESIPGLQIQFDWWRFEHENRIIWRDPQAVLDLGGSAGIIREPDEPDGTPGRIIEVHATHVNADELLTEGFDTTLRYAWQTERTGDFTASLAHTYTGRYEFTSALNPELEAAGNLAGSTFNRRPVPRHRGNLNLSWSKGAHGAAANVRYVGDYQNFINTYVDGAETDQPMIVSSFTTLDLQYSYRFERLRSAKLRIGCINCLGEEPPLTYNPYPREYHDPRGRFYYIRWQQPFR